MRWPELRVQDLYWSEKTGTTGGGKGGGIANKNKTPGGESL